MPEPRNQKPVTAMEPALLFVGAAVFAAIVVHALLTGWVWIPGSRHSTGNGHWISRTDSLGDYLVYVAIIGAATLGVLAMAVDRLRRFNAQRPGGGS